MCGLVGFVGPGSRDDLERMSAAVAHRGPDGQGSFVDAERAVYLAHRRLAILDLEGGAQPMWNAGETLGVVFNGEIYNHRELRAELESRGYRFKSDHSDTEVLIHGYDAWGHQLPERLNGMFAFAIYDVERRAVFLARDRFGEKPLYYARQNGLFAFGSELSAIAAHAGFSSRLKHRSVQKFLAYGFLPAPASILEDAWKLPGGAWLRYDIRTGAMEIRRYWTFSLSPAEECDVAAEPVLVEELQALLSQAVKRRLISDVPLGIFLSGGIDSSAVLAAATRHVDAASIRTFTIGFNDPSFDESGPAAQIAAHFGVRNDMERLDLERARALIPTILQKLDEPLGDGSLLPTHLLSAFTRKSVTVALSGDGGDELFAGYDPFVALPWARLYDRCVPQPLHKLLRRAVSLMPISTKNMGLDFKLRRTLSGLSHMPSVWIPVWMSAADPAMMRDLMEEPLTTEELYEEAIAQWDGGGTKSDIDKSLEYFTNFYLQDNILFKVDRAAMANSLESRAVFLDNDLVDFCRRLPTRYKYRRGQRKYLLRKALSGVLPKNILERPKKGFGVPLTKWLRDTPAEPPLTRVPGVRMDRIESAWQAHRDGVGDHRLLLWSWWSLQSMPYQSVQAA